MTHNGPFYETALSFGAVQYTVRRSARAKRMSLRYHERQGFEVILPQRMPLREAEPFVRSMEAWILRVISTRRRPVASPIPAGLHDDALLPLLGSTVRLRVDWSADGASTIQLDDQTRTLHAKISPQTPASIEDLVEAWYRYAAKALLPERVERYAALLGVRYGRITVKDTRSRWGSCSSKGNLNFSWRLLLAPVDVLDYVVAHEVAHLVELSHAPRFWETLARIFPDYKAQKQWLRWHGAALARWPQP